MTVLFFLRMPLGDLEAGGLGLAWWCGPQHPPTCLLPRTCCLSVTPSLPVDLTLPCFLRVAVDLTRSGDEWYSSLLTLRGRL